MLTYSSNPKGSSDEQSHANPSEGESMSSQKYRIENDTLGKVKVPVDALYMAQTQRAVENFPVSGLKFERSFIRALGLIKEAAASVNQQLHLLDPQVAKIIKLAAEEVASRRHD